MRALLLSIAVAGICPMTAIAQDLAASAFVMPSQSVGLSFAPKNKRVAIGILARTGAASFLTIDFSAPLDEETRRADFVARSTGLVSGFAGSLTIGGDTLNCARTVPQGGIDSHPSQGGNPQTPTPEPAQQDPARTPRAGIDPNGNAAGPTPVTPAPERQQRGWCHNPKGRILLGLETAFEFDRQEVFDLADIGATSTSETQWLLRIGPRLLVARGIMSRRPEGQQQLVLETRGGLSISRSLDVEDVERCEDVPSTVGGTTGTRCDDVVAAESRDADARTAAYLRANVIYLYPTTSTYSVGAGIGVFGDSLGRDNDFALRAHALMVPTTENIGAIFGIGVHTELRGERDVIVFVTVAGSLGMLFNQPTPGGSGGS